MNSTVQKNELVLAFGERRKSDVQHITDALGQRGRVLLKAYGSSMQPWVRPGDIAIVRQVTTENVRRGDVILFRRHNQLFVHRIVDERVMLGVRQVSAKGDAHPESDGWLETDELLGRVVFIFRGSKRLPLETSSQIVLGRVIARLSEWNRFWYPAARFALRSSRPMRHRFSRWLSLT
ncbi:MAG TPA: signal peptidase I [Candidatus Cybelea sp.]|nr:signal peptidase I [Candidatus Cybelea sp.]